jgi:hypothetical protein
MPRKETRPLRRVVGWIKASLVIPSAYHDASWEVYECGHVRPPKRDIYGETNAARRRCELCARGVPAHVDPADARIVPFR